MARVPEAPVPGVRLMGPPNLTARTRATGNDFGAYKARAFELMGHAEAESMRAESAKWQSILPIADTVLSGIAGKMNECKVRQSVCGYQRDVSTATDKCLSQGTGTLAMDAAKNCEKIRRKCADQYRNALESPEAKAAFDRTIEPYNVRNEARAIRHMERETAAAERIMVEAQQQATIEEMQRYVDEDPESTVAQLDVLDELVREEMKDAPASEVQSRADIVKQTAIKQAAAALAGKTGAAAAKAFLDNPVIRGKFTSEKAQEDLTRMSKGFVVQATREEQKAQIRAGLDGLTRIIRNGGTPEQVFLMLEEQVGPEVAAEAAAGYAIYTPMAEASAVAAAKAREGKKPIDGKQEEQAATNERDILDIPDEELVRQTHEEFPWQYARIYFGTAELERKAVAAENAQKTVMQKLQWQDQLRKANMDPSRVEGFSDLMPDEQLALIDYAETWQAANRATPTVDLMKYLEYQEMTDDQLLNLVAEKGGLDAMEMALGGVTSQHFNRVFKRIEPQSREDTPAAVTLESMGLERNQPTDQPTPLDSFDLDLMDIRNNARVILDSARRTPEQSRDLINKTLEFAAQEMKRTMRERGIESYDEVPSVERSRILGQAALHLEVIKGDHITREKPTPIDQEAGQAFSPDAIDTLPAEQQKLYSPNGGEVMVLPGGVMETVQLGIPAKELPLAVATEAGMTDFPVARDLNTGWYVVVDKRGNVVFFDPEGNRAAQARPQTQQAVRQQLNMGVAG